MKRYFIHLAYNGTNYCGWQIQPNGKTVQETIEQGLTTILRVSTSIVGAGRTDSGVHARMMYAHFDSECESLDTVLLTEKLNRILPRDISIKEIFQTTDDAHARFDAKSRLYRYYLSTHKDPFMYPFHYKIWGEIDIDKMNECANILFEYSDFTSFSKLHTDVKTNICKIMHAQWTYNNNEYIFTIKADRFLRNMVRSIVGTLLDAGRGKINPADIRRIIESKDRRVAGTSVPGNALFLEEIEYDETIRLI